MDALDYIERESAKTFAALMADFTSFHERTYKLLTLLVGGGGAATAYTLTRLGESTSPPAPEWWPIAALAAWWFLIALVLLLSALRSFKLSSGGRPASIGQVYRDEGGDETVIESDKNKHATAKARWAELRTVDDRIGKYQRANNWRGAWLDGAYFAAALSPAIALGVLWLASQGTAP